MIRMFLIIFFLLEVITDDNIKNCRDRNRLIENEKGDLYTLIDATLGQKITLQCHYWYAKFKLLLMTVISSYGIANNGEKDDGRPKVWYKIDQIGMSEPHEVDLDMNNNSTLNRIQVNTEHTLTVHNFTENDTGLYYCKYFEADEDEKHNYLVNLVYDENVTSETGNITDWKKYHDENFQPINILFAQSESVEFKRIRDELKIQMEMMTQWGPWGICEVCGRPKDEGIRKKNGYCRIKLTQLSGPLNLTENLDEHLLHNSYAIPCRSEILGRLFPGVSNLTRIIPNFIQTELCKGTCNPDAEGMNKGWKTGKTAAFKYRKTFVLAENSHLTLICPESTLDNKVIWKKNGKLLKAGEAVIPPIPEEEPRILVDTFNTLYLVSVRESEEGNYTCQVDDIRMQQIMIFVISKSKLLTQAFVRHMMYLGLILSLTLPCYCAGLVITCNRKRYFKDYEQLKEEEEERKIHRVLKSP